MPEADERYRHIGIFQPGRAGDFILTTGLFNALKEAWPACRLTVVVGPRAAGLAQAHPAIDRALVLDRRPDRLGRLLAGLWRRRFDAWIDPKPHPSRTSLLAAQLVRARIRIGRNRDSGVFDRELPELALPPVHYAVQAMAALPLLGLPVGPPRLSLGLTPEAVAWAQGQRGGAKQCVVVNVSAGSRSRYWPDASWEALLPRLANGDTRFLLNAAPEDRAGAERLVESTARKGTDIRLLPRTGLLQVAAAVAAADAVLTVDTSIVHIASAFDVPVLGIYLREEPQFTIYQPLSRRREVVSAPAGEPLGRVTPGQVEHGWRRLWSAG